MKTRLMLGRDIDFHGLVNSQATILFDILDKDKVQVFVDERQGKLFATKFPNGTLLSEMHCPPKEIEILKQKPIVP